MKLYLLRHGAAENQSATGRDADRALTADGRQRTRLVAIELAKRGESPKRIISSPLHRAVETAEVIAGALGSGIAPEQRDELAPGGRAYALVRQLVAEGAKKVMLVGHEPDLSSLALLLLPHWSGASQGFDKSMVLGVRVRGAQSKRTATDWLEVDGRFVLEPKHLRWVEL